MADPYNIPDPLQIEAAERAYGPVYSSQYADAMKSARANEIGHRLGLPSDIVESDMPNMMAADRVNKRLRDTQRNATYARIMSTPLARSAMDDDNLPKVADKIDDHISILSPTYIGMAVTHLIGGLLGDTAGGVANYVQGIGESARNDRMNLKAVGERMHSPFSFLSDLPGPEELLGPLGRSLATLPNWISDNTSPSTGNSWKDAGLSGFRSAGTSVGALAIGMLSRSPALATSIIAGTSGGQTYRQDRQQGIDPSTAFQHATTDAEIEAATEYLPEKYLIDNAATKSIGRLIIGDLGREMLGEGAATLGQSFDQWFYVDRNKGQSFGDYVKTLPEQEAQTAIAVAVTAGMLGPSAALINRQIERGVSAKAAQHVDKIMEAAAASPTRTANPTDFAMALNQVLQDTPAENLYVPAQEIAKMFEGDGKPSINEDPFWSKYASDVAEAAALGHDVVVPLADAATHLAGTPQWDAIKDHVRVSPKGLSIAEAKDKSSPEELDALAGRMGELVEQALPRMQQAQALQIVQGFAERGGYTSEQAEPVNRMLAAHLYTVYRSEMAKRASAGEQSIPMEEFAAQHLPTIERQAQANYEKRAGTLEQGPIKIGKTTAPDFELGTPNPLNDRERVIGGGGITITKNGPRWHISDLRAIQRGGGRQALEAALAKADELGVSADLFATPLDSPAGKKMTPDELVRWYEQFGFEKVDDDEDGPRMVRVPQGEALDQSLSQSTGGDNAAAGSVRDPSGLRGEPQLLAAAAGQELGFDEPLAGAPQSLTVPGVGKVAVRPLRAAREAAMRYMQKRGLIYRPATRYAKLDTERAERIADAFEAMEHNPDDPTVFAAYEAMKAETLAQFEEIRKTGLQIEFIGEGQDDPYAASPRLAILDVQDNNHLWVFPTEGGFGQGEVTKSPMLEPTGIFLDGRHLLANDVFRIVHDYFGHIKEGHGFRAEGEENAWQAHAAMYSPLARRAMTTETRGQNSWLNYGPHGEANRSASSSETIFAPQKVGLMPEWTSAEGMLADPSSGTGQTYDQVVEARPIFSRPYDLDRYGNGQELDRPPVDEEGQVQLEHFSQAGDIAVTDPERWGQGKSFYSREERVYMRDAPKRTYFGIATNQPGGYKLEFQGRSPYRAKVPLDRLYPIMEDPADLKVRGSAADTEQAVKNAGFAGYWRKHPELGLVAVVFEPVPVESIDPTPLTLDQAVEPTGFERVAPFLTDEEKAKMREASKAKLLAIIDTLPKAEEMAAVAHAGRAKKGWYQRSAQAIVDVFGIEDAPRFAALLAALSPQSPVELNFYNAVRVWTAWNNAGRPTDRQTILEVMGGAVAGNKGTGSILNAWINNSFAALTDTAPASLKLSGPKVNSFFANLVGVTEEVTNDSWMLRYMGAEKPSGIGINGDKGNFYKAMSAVTREAATILTEKTGQDWTPMEVQETVWSFAKTLYEMRDKAGEDRTMNELLEAGGITHQDIANTPDFAVLFTDNIFRRILEEGGYGQQVADLASDGRTADVNGDESAVASSEGSGFAESDFRTFLAQAADRLEGVRDQRRANAEERRRDSRQLGLTLNQEVSPSEEVFYSNATRAVEQAKQEKASPEQWAALLTPGRTPGIKAEEIEWTGILDWLKMQKGQIDKGALLQVLRDRGIKVGEVVQGADDPELAAQYEVRPEEGVAGFAVVKNGEVYDRGFPTEEAARAAISHVTREHTQFQNWSSDPSNDTYRELLITLPLGHGSNPERAPSTHWDTEAVVAHVRFMEKQDAEGKRVLFIEEVQSDWHQMGRDEGYENKPTEADIKAAEAALEDAQQAKREAGDALLAKLKPMYQASLEWTVRSEYTTDEEKADAQFRLDHINDLRVPDALIRNLNVWSTEEAEAVRKAELAAYIAADLKIEDAQRELNKIAPARRYEAARVEVRSTATALLDKAIPLLPADAARTFQQRRDGTGSVGYAAEQLSQWLRSGERAHIAVAIHDELAAFQKARLEENEARQAERNAARGIPDAPFKTSWPALVMKRAIRWAVDHGFDKVAWIKGTEQNGGQTAEAIGRVYVNHHTDTQIGVSFVSNLELARRLAAEINVDYNEGHLIMTREQVQRVFGQGLGERVWEQGQASKDEPTEFDTRGALYDQGGWFYDRNLVNITNDIVKKYGTKVGVVQTDRNPRDGQKYRAQAALMREEGANEAADEAEAAANSFLSNQHGFEITPQLATAAAGGFPLFQQKRGNITINPGDNGLMQSAVIRAFEAANFSTAVHELGHFFLEDLKRRALGANPHAQELADWQTFKDWAASLGITVNDNEMIPVPAHEYFAKGFERFTWEGKAPSLALRAVFTRMREFMLSLYRTATAFNAPITPEIRDVMGRMLASQEEIDAQRTELGMVSKAIKGLLSDTEQKAYDDLAEEGRQSARDQLFERVLSGLRRQKQAEVNEQKQQITAEVESQVADVPIHKALKLLRVGQPMPQGGFAKIKLSREWLNDTYGEGIEDRLPKGVPPIVSNNDTMDADMIAGLAGFDSGDAMVKAMLDHEAQRQQAKAEGEKRSPRQREVDDRVAQRLKEEVGDPFEHLEDEAQDAIASDRQADLMSMEVRALGRKTGQKPTPWKLAKEWAAQRVAISTAREAISGRAIQGYARAVAKAGREYEEALVKGDFEEAFRAKQRQLLNMALMSEAKKAADNVDAAVRRMQKLAKRDTIPSVDQDYLEQAHALLDDVDFKSNNAQSDRAQSFAEWHAAQVALGVQPLVPPGYRELLGKTHWSKLSVENLIELDKAVGQIIELGRLKQKLMDGKAQRDFDEGIAEMVGSAEMQKSRKASASLGDRTLPEKTRSILRTADAAMLKIEQIAKWLDGNDPVGPWTRLLFKPMAVAQGRQDDLMRDYVREINAIIGALPSKLVKRWTDKVDAPELLNARVPALYKDQVVVMAMNWGNEGNKQRLLDGYGWEEADALRVLDRLMTKEDWDFVQQIWDVVDKLWPDLAALERRVNGLAPEKIEAVPVQTQFGVYRGGYFPVIYDASMSSRATLDEDNKLSPEGGFMMATTRAGATKQRAEMVKDRPILLSMAVVTRHIGEVVHDITHREAVMQVKKILGDKRIGDVVRAQLGPEYFKAMGQWVENIARPGSMYSKSVPWMVKTGRYLNKAVAMVGLGFRFSTTAMQLLGIPIVAAEVGEKHLTAAMTTVIAHPLRSWNEMQSRSAEMRARADTLDATIEDMIHEAHGGKLKQIGPKGIQKYAMRGIAYMDMIVSTTAWTAGFNKALEQGLSEEDASDYADQVVRTTQGAGGQKDRSAIMNEHPMVRSFYAFFSYLNALFNMQRDVFRTAGEGHPLEAARKAWWVMIVPALLQAAIFGQGPDPDDDGEVGVEEWAKYLLMQIGIGNLGSIPFAGTIASAVGNGYTYRSSAYNAMGEGIMREAHDVKAVYHGDKDVDGSTVKAAINTLGLMSAQPLGQAGATAGGLYDYSTGKADPQNGSDWYNLLSKGYIPEHR